MQSYQPLPTAPDTVYTQPPSASTYPGYNGKYSKIFGIVQLVCGILAIALHGVLTGVLSTGSYSGAGIWGGIIASMKVQTIKM